MAVIGYSGSSPNDFGYIKTTTTKTLNKEYPSIYFVKYSGVFSNDEKIVLEFVSKNESPRLYSGIADKFSFKASGFPDPQAINYIKNRLYGNDYRYARNAEGVINTTYNINFDSERLGNFSIVVKDFDEYNGQSVIRKSIMIDEKSINRINISVSNDVLNDNCTDANGTINRIKLEQFYNDTARLCKKNKLLFDYDIAIFLYVKNKNYCKKSFLRSVNIIEELGIKNVNSEVLYNCVYDWCVECHEDDPRLLPPNVVRWLEIQRLNDFQVSLVPDESEQQPEPPSLPTFYIDQESCTHCGECYNNVCPIGAILKNGINYSISNNCIGCGSCVAYCPSDAIKKTN